MKHRYLLEVADGEHPADDYLIRVFGVECFVMDDDGPDDFVIYEPITAIHDFQPKLATYDAFQEMKKKELEKAHEDWKKAEEQQRSNLNKFPTASDMDCM